MGTKPLLNRRFIRLQAVQRLYAFYISKHANYEKALAQIAAVFEPDIFTDLPIAPAQLAQEAQQARKLFDGALSSASAPRHDDGRVLAPVVTALADYQGELAKDERRLEEGLVSAVAMINNACISIWQLLVEWGHIAQKQAEKPRLSPDQATVPTSNLSDSILLKRLQEEQKLTAMVQKAGASWDAHIPLVEDWYHQFIGKEPKVQILLNNLDLMQEEQLWLFLIDEVIFKQKAIQEFFSSLDLYWVTHKHIVKTCVRQGIQQVLKDPEANLQTLGSVEYWQEEQQFYTDLTRRALGHEENIEQLIAQKSKNWALQRINILDKAIIKLALCEMLYFPTIPTNVSINEYIEIAKNYSIPKSKEFVNGLLDAVASETRSEEATQQAPL